MHINQSLARSLGKVILLLVSVVALAMSLAVQQVGLASPAAGEIDSTFGNGGIVNTGFPVLTDSQGYAVAVQGDGKHVVSGSVYHPGSGNDLALSRYNDDGSLDTTFGVGGFVSIDFNRRDDLAYAVAIQVDGKIVAAGTMSDNPDVASFALVRYLPNGSLDTSFGTNGKVITSFGGDNRLYSLIIQPDSKILAAGTALGDFALARYLPDGTLDNTFGAGGKVLTDVGGGGLVGAVVLQADGKIISVGSANRNFALVRYGADGTPDPTFGTNGLVTTDLGGSFDWARTVGLTSDGGIVAGGTGGVGPNDGDRRFGLARYTSNGTLDTGFGTGGKVITSFAGTSDSEGHSLTIDPYGKILLAGYAGACQPYCIAYTALARYLPDGIPDTSYGSGGQALTNFGANVAMVAETGGKALVVGTTTVGSRLSTALARYLPDGSLDATFGTRGKVISAFTTSNAYATAIALQADAKVVAVGMAAGYCASWSCSLDTFALARYLPDGTLDASFGNGGRVSTNFPEGEAEAYGVRIQPDGKIVVVGYAGSGTEGAFALARYLPDGTLDASFGNGGRVVTDVDTIWRDAAFALDLQADGKIIAAGYTPYDGLAVTRYLPNGSLDTTFGYGGIVTTFINGETAYAFSVVAQPDGKILIGGSTRSSCSTTCTNVDFALVRYLSNGQLDPGFGTGGIVVTSLGENNDSRVQGLALQSDGKIIAAGYTGVNCE